MKYFFRIVLTGIVIACKIYDDFFDTNTFYAAIGGIELAELN